MAEVISTIANLLIILATIPALLALIWKIKEQAATVSEVDHALYWETLAKTVMSDGSGVSRPKGYQRFRWHFYCWKTAFWDVLLFWK